MAALLSIAWLIPQGIEIETSYNEPYRSSAFWIYIIICFLFLFIGFHYSSRRYIRLTENKSAVRDDSFDMRRLELAAAGLAAVGFLSHVLIWRTDTSGMGMQWTGVVTVYALLTSASGMALALSVIIFARTRSVISLIIIMFSIYPIFLSAMYGVRREAIFNLLILSAGAWYFVRKKYPSRIVILCAFVVGTIVINNPREIRTFVYSGQGNVISALFTGKVVEKYDYFEKSVGDGSEVRLAQYDFHYISQYNRLEYGAQYWNSIIHQYVPAFILSRDFKESLKLDTLEERIRKRVENGAFSLGSTRTGFSDSFRNFWWFGAFVFLCIGILFGKFYAAAMTGGVRGQLLYLVLLADGLKAITHSTSEFFGSLPFAIGVPLLALWWSARPRHRYSNVDRELSVRQK